MLVRETRYPAAALWPSFCPTGFRRLQDPWHWWPPALSSSGRNTLVSSCDGARLLFTCTRFHICMTWPRFSSVFHQLGFGLLHPQLFFVFVGGTVVYGGRAVEDGGGGRGMDGKEVITGQGVDLKTRVGERVGEEMSEGRSRWWCRKLEGCMAGFGARRQRPSYCCSHGFRHYFVPASLPRYGARQMNGGKCKRGFPALKTALLSRPRPNDSDRPEMGLGQRAH